MKIKDSNLDLKPGDGAGIPERYEYAIIPVTFKNYDEYVNCLNDFGRDGWQFLQMIQIYSDVHPLKGVTVHDWVCSRKLVK